MIEVDRNGEAEEVSAKKGVRKQKKLFEGIQKAKDEFASEFGYLFIEFIEKYVFYFSGIRKKTKNILTCGLIFVVTRTRLNQALIHILNN